jgi:hypothetical protein
MTRIYLLGLLILCSCSYLPTKVVEVKVPVSVPCKVPTIEKINSPLSTISEDTSTYEKVKLVLIELELRRYREEQLEAVVNSCQ